MGHQHSNLKVEANIASKKFHKHELYMLKTIFKELCHRSSGSVIDKSTFLQYIPLPGLLGERLFEVFNRKKNGVIDYEEFICGLAICSRGEYEEKIYLIFEICDIDGSGSITKEEFAFLFNHIPRSIFPSNINSLSLEVESTLNNEDQNKKIQNTQFLKFTNHAIVEKAFRECNLNSNGELLFNEFKQWMNKTPQVFHFIESVFPFLNIRRSFRYAIPSINVSELRRSLSDLKQNLELEMNEKKIDEEIKKNGSINKSSILSFNDIQRKKSHLQEIEMEAVLFKIGKKSRMWKQRWCVLRDNCLYYYALQDHICPQGAIFLPGTFITEHYNYRAKSHGFHGIKIIEPSSSGKMHSKLLYTTSISEHEAWILKLKRASQMISIEEEYEIGAEIGRGHFSVVFDCYHKITKENLAVKVIEKQKLKRDEKELLRTEISILKLVSHPRIIRTVAIFESILCIFIVMEKVSGGALSCRITGKTTFTEEAFKVMKPLIESVAYLHELGIIHRDIKPENILCEANLEGVKITDFGLSKILKPIEQMKQACGTLSYVAPEVLSGKGYGRIADLWSVGVVLFFMLTGQLAFVGTNRAETIEYILKGKLNLANNRKFPTLSTKVRHLILKLLEQDPKDRISAVEALNHPWMQKMSQNL